MLLYLGFIHLLEQRIMWVNS